MDRITHEPDPRTRAASRPLARLAAGAIVAGGILAAALLPGTAAQAAPAAAQAAPHAAAPAPAPAAETVGAPVIEDTAGVLYLPQLERELAQIEFYAPTQVAVYTYRGEYSDNLNERVLAYARAEHPEWISPDGQKWADGLFLIALDPEGRQVGTYFGEDRSVSPEQQTSIQEATKDDFRRAVWTDGIVAGVERAAQLIERPWYASPGFIGTVSVLGIGGVGTTATVLGVRAHRRSKFAEQLERGSGHLTRVTMDLESTELSARTLPSSSSYAQRLEQRFHDFTARYRAAVAEQQRLASLGPKERSRGDAPPAAAAWADEVEDMDFVDDAIVHLAALLTQSPTWERAWDAQVEPLRADLARLSDVTEWEGAAELDTTRALAALAPVATAEIERLGAGLRDGSTTPEAALDGLAALRQQLSDALQQHAEASLAAYAKSEEERDLMREKLEEQRRREQRPSGSILDTINPPGSYAGPIIFSMGYRSGTEAVEHSRAAAAASSSSSFGGGSTGYGSSGGSFSGSGSSSRF